MLPFALLGGVGATLGLAAALVFGTTPRRVAIVAAVGVAAAAALFLLGYLSADPVEGKAPCHDCSEWHGRYLDVLVFVVPLLNGAAWVIAAAVGGILRRTFADRSRSD